MSRIVQDEECGLRVFGEEPLAAQERLEGVPVHPQMPFNRYRSPLHERTRQDTFQIRFDGMPMDEDHNYPKPSLTFALVDDRLLKLLS